ncbi:MULTISPECIES: hypothetical protein [Streptomyces]|uniref:hypothetical protein n=1 Tax=Streptomyces TaxID=1883 RepID=UPI002930F69F|nr:hypothetical protein [Streptomyces sp. NEAU-HV9]
MVEDGVARWAVRSAAPMWPSGRTAVIRDGVRHRHVEPLVLALVLPAVGAAAESVAPT